jgi:hypothetical protein
MSLSAVSDALLNSLRRELPPMITSGQIGLCSPADAGDSFLLGLFPFGVVKDPKYQMLGGIRIDSGVTQHAPLCAEMSVMVTSYVGKKSDLTNDYKLLERVMQIWHDNNEVQIVSPLQPQFVVFPRIELLSLDIDAVSKVWQFPNVPYRMTLFYKVSPVVITSAKQVLTPRVGGVDYNTGADNKGEPNEY